MPKSLREREQPVGGGRRSGGKQRIVVQNGCAGRVGDFQPGACMRAEAALERSLAAILVSSSLSTRLRSIRLAAYGTALARRDVGEHLAQQIAGGSSLSIHRRGTRCERTSPHNRPSTSTEMDIDASVPIFPHVLKMHRRDAAQGGETQIQRRASWSTSGGSIGTGV